MKRDKDETNKRKKCGWIREERKEKKKEQTREREESDREREKERGEKNKKGDFLDILTVESRRSERKVYPRIMGYEWVPKS